MNFQMFKLDLEKAEESEIKLPTFIGSQIKQGNSKKTSTSVSLITLKPLTVDHNKLEKSEMGVPEHLTCFLRNLYVGQEVTVRTRHEATNWFKIGERVRQDCILSPYLFNLYAEYLMGNAGLDESHAGIKIVRRNINNLRYADNGSLRAERGTKEPLDEGEREKQKKLA